MVDCPAPGVYEDIPDHVYHSWPAMSSTAIRDLLSSPALYRHRLAAPRSQSDSMALGSAVHAYLLQPERSADLVTVQPEDIKVRRGKAWDTFVGDHPGAAILRHGQGAQAQDMTASVVKYLAVEDAGWLLRGRRELSIIWDDPKHGVRCKARLDVMGDQGPDGMPFVCDLKTTGAEFGAREMDFSRTVSRYRYYVQAAMYLRAAALVDKRVDNFWFLVVESRPPHACNFMRIGRGSIEAGDALVSKALRDYAACSASETWPGYKGGNTIEISTYQMDADAATAKERIDVW